MCVMYSSKKIKVPDIIKSLMVLALFFAISCKANCPVSSGTPIDHDAYLILELADQSDMKKNITDISGKNVSRFEFQIIVQ